MTHEEYVDLQSSRLKLLLQSLLDGSETVLSSVRRILLLAREVFPQDNEAVNTFILIECETDHLPIGGERQFWDPAVLRQKDEEIERSELWARPMALEACRSLLLQLESPSN